MYSLVEGDLGKEVLLLLERVSDQSGNLWTSVGHGGVARGRILREMPLRGLS